MSTATKNAETPLTFREILDKSAKSAFRGGISGAAAMGANVACLMWMRTTVRAMRTTCASLRMPLSREPSMLTIESFSQCSSILRLTTSIVTVHPFLQPFVLSMPTVVSLVSTV